MWLGLRFLDGIDRAAHARLHGVDPVAAHADEVGRLVAEGSSTVDARAARADARAASCSPTRSAPASSDAAADAIQLIGDDVQRSLNHRARKILGAIVHEYLATGEAVGSRTVTRRHGIDLSPATVRNVMSDLEEAGLLKQPHTSAGRVPTDQGLRFFVDSLLKVRTLSDKERLELAQRYQIPRTTSRPRCAKRPTCSPSCRRTRRCW